MAAPLALPSGGRTRPRNLINLTVLMVVTGGIALFGALIGVYAGLGSGLSRWPPSGVTIDNYVGTMLSLTALMSAVTVEWAWHAITRQDRAQAMWGLLLTAGFGLAFLNLLWFVGRQVNFGPGNTKVGPFAVIFFAMIVASGFVALIGVVALLMALGRTLGNQMTATNNEMIRAVAWYWDFVVIAWLAVYTTVWLFV
jgi:heme/copper-type cytochrome/quinol oxidase subunit 3